MKPSAMDQTAPAESTQTPPGNVAGDPGLVREWQAFLHRLATFGMGTGESVKQVIPVPSANR